MITTFFFTLFQLWGLYMFWFTTVILGYFYVFFKLQYQVFLLLYPATNMGWYNNMRPFDVRYFFL